MIYLDYAATSPVLPSVLEKMHAVAGEYYANPSSLYKTGYVSRRILQESRKAIAASIGAENDEIVYTSGGTESNNIALFGVFGKKSEKKHLIVGATEHHSILAAARALERGGATLSIVPCDKNGVYAPDDIARLIRPDTALVSLHLANNETGVLQPVAEIGALTRKLRVPLHCDATAAYGHIGIDARALNVDLMSVSAHKLGGPRGAGFLFVRNEIAVSPLFYGGAQERGLRPGTENLPAIAGFAEAITKLAIPASSAARDRLETLLIQLLPGARVNGSQALRLPHILSLTIPGVRSEAILPRLSEAGVYASARAACAGGEREPSHVLLAMGLSPAEADATLRFSTGFSSQLSEMDAAANAIDFVVRNLN